MRLTKTVAVVSLALFCVSAASPADAHRNRSRISIGFHVGVPVYAYSHWHGWHAYPRPYYHYPYYTHSPVVVAPVVVAPQPIYVEQQPAPAAAAPSGYWYYCAQSNAYYPYVQQCAGQWQQVAPRPPQ